MLQRQEMFPPSFNAEGHFSESPIWPEGHILIRTAISSELFSCVSDAEKSFCARPSLLPDEGVMGYVGVVRTPASRQFTQLLSDIHQFLINAR